MYDRLAEGVNRTAVGTLFHCLDAFLTDRDSSRDGLRRIHSAYEEWLLKQRWYRPPNDC